MTPEQRVQVAYACSLMGCHLKADQVIEALEKAAASSESVSSLRLSTSAGLTAEKSRAILALIAQLLGIQLTLLLYHHCEDHPVAAWPLSEGFAPLDWSCPECETLATPTYDLELCHLERLQ